jgi:hypothetical protein
VLSPNEAHDREVARRAGHPARHEAERPGLAIADVICTALKLHLGTGGGRRFSAAAAGHSDRGDVSERIEEILASEMPPSR